MKHRTRVTEGAYAGLLAGLAVAVFFFLGDLLRLAPLSTPLALSHTFIGPSGYKFDFPVLSQLVAVIWFGSRVLAYTALHFLVFAILGVGAVMFFDRFRFPLNPLTGAIYGLGAFSLAFYVSMAVGNAAAVEGVPGFGGIAIANFLAGGLMGWYLQLVPRRR